MNTKPLSSEKCSVVQKYFVTGIFAGVCLLLGFDMGMWSKPKPSQPTGKSYITNTIFVTNKSLVIQPAQQFHWQQIESTNFVQYVHNLRNLGCPEETLHDVLRAEIDAAYESQMMKHDVNISRFWLSEEETRQVERQRRELEKTKENLLVQLLGWARPDKINGVPLRKQSAVYAVLQKYPLAQKGERENQDTKTERIKALAGILNPKELQDYQIANERGIYIVQALTDGFQPSEMEFRALFDVFNGQTTLTVAGGKYPEEIDAKLRQVLSPERYAYFVALSKAENRNAKMFLKRERMPLSNLAALINVRDQYAGKPINEFRDAVAQILGNTNIANRFVGDISNYSP